MRGLRLLEAERARSLRQAETGAERQLWRRLRSRGLNGFKFVRQEAIGPYFVDFVCREEKFVVEVDGATHSSDEETARDERRTSFLLSRGYRLTRVANDEVYRNMNGVLETILAAIERRSTL
jgi:very-short-patch-repair endonuclease